MMLSSLALALAASALASPFPNPINLHPHMPDGRIAVRLVNENEGFRDVTIAGRNYTLLRHGVLDIKAPAGTMIYSNSPSHTHKRGDLLLEVKPANNNGVISLD